MTGFYIPSEEDMKNQGGDYITLAEDEYIARIDSIEIAKDQVNKFPTPGDNEPLHDMILVKMSALSFANGDDLVDKDDRDVEGGKVPFRAYLNPKKVGMIPQPSKTRKFFAAALGQPVSEAIDLAEGYDSLVGKTLIVSLKPNGSFNNPTDFRAQRKSRTRGTTPKGPVDGVDLVARAKEIFDEDSPTNTSPNPAAGTNPDDLDF